MKEIRNLCIYDLPQVRFFESFYNYDLSSAEDEDNDFSFGLFEDQELLGVATLGSADILGLPYQNDLLLSDVAVIEELQGKGLGKFFLKELLKRNKEHVIHCFILQDDLYHFYSQLGFVWADKEEGHLVKEAKCQK